MCSASASLFFFFQAEDGIRDLTVTGVQTCALPISYSGTYQSHRYSTLQQITTANVSRLKVAWMYRSEEHTSELQSQSNLVCRLLLEKKKKYNVPNGSSWLQLVQHEL